jgi:hypothetical protein
VSDVDPRLVAAMREQLSRRPAGAERVGWKYGSGEEEHIGGDHVVGHITSATEVVIDNDYHRAVVFGPFADELRDGIRGTLVVNGERRAAGPVSDELAERVAAVDRVLRSERGAAAGRRRHHRLRRQHGRALRRRGGSRVGRAGPCRPEDCVIDGN